MSDDLVKWLGEQLDVDADRAPQWHDLECEIHARMDAGLIAAVAAARMLDEVPGAVCDCGGPARVLREIDAKRRIVALHGPGEMNDVDGDVCMVCEDPDVGDEGPFYPCKTLRLLALPYADHLGYREEWRP